MTELAIHELVTVTADEAGRLEQEFLNGLDQAQDAFAQIMETNAWAALGHDSFAAWWEQRVVPTMRALSLRPSREIANRVLDQIRQEEADLPPAQRRRGAELAEMAGVSEWTVESRQDQRPPRSTAKPDLAPDEDQPDRDPAESPPQGLVDETEDTSSPEAADAGASDAGGSPGSAAPLADPGTAPNGHRPAVGEPAQDRGFAGDLADAKAEARSGSAYLAQKAIESLKLAREIVRDRCGGTQAIIDDLRMDPTGYEIAPLWDAELEETEQFLNAWRTALKAMRRERLRSVK